MHIFHPFVHPFYRPPPSEESILRMEEEEEAERRAKKEEKRRKRRIKAGLDPDIHTSDEERELLMGEKGAELEPIEDIEVERSCNETRGAKVYNLDMKFEN